LEHLETIIFPVNIHSPDTESYMVFILSETPFTSHDSKSQVYVSVYKVRDSSSSPSLDFLLEEMCGRISD